MKMKNQNKRLAKVLATTIFGVGFVLSGMNNIALANYGQFSVTGGVKVVGAASGFETLTGVNTAGTSQALNFTDIIGFGTSNNAYWAQNKTATYQGNYVVLKGTDSKDYTFKVVDYSFFDSTSGIVTLWSYNRNSTYQFSKVTFGSNSNYSESNLRNYMINTVATKLSNYSSGMVEYAGAGGDKIWAASDDETRGEDWTRTVGTWGLVNDSSRADGVSAWLRSPCGDTSADVIQYDGDWARNSYVGNTNSIRPALQLNITAIDSAYAFTSNVDSIAEGTMTTGTAGEKKYKLDTTKMAPTFTPATDGVTLDGTKIGITTAGNLGYRPTGLLTEIADNKKNSTWANLNGTTANIAYMAQVKCNELDLQNVDENTDYTLKIFGLNTTDNTVTELASNAVNGLSKGSDGKIHMKVSTTVNAGVPVTLKDGAVIDLIGHAGNNITVARENSGVLNLGSSNYVYTGTVDLNTYDGTLTVQGTGTMVGTVKGSWGKLVVNGIVSADANIFTQSAGSNPGLEVKNAGDVLNLTAGALSKAVTNNGTVKLNGATMDAARVTAGTLEFAKDISLDATYVAADTNIVDSGVNLTLTGMNKTLGQTISGAGKVIIDGTIMANADKFTQTGGLEVKESDDVLTLTGTSNTLGKTISGEGKVVIDGTINADVDKFTQAGGLEVKDSSDVLTLTGTGKTIGQTISGKGKIIIDGTINADADKFTQTGGLEVASSEVLTLTAGTLSKDVTGSGKVALGSGSTVTMNEDRNIAGTLDFGNGTLNMQGSNKVNSVTVGTLSGTGNIKFDAIINGAATPTIDNIAATNVEAGTKLTLNSVNMTGSSTTDEWALGEVKTVSLVTSTNGIANLTIGGTVTAASDGYKYEFSQNEVGSGVVKIVKDIGGKLAQIVQNVEVDGYKMGNISTYSLVADYTETSDLGTLTRVVSSTPREFTINGNDYKFEGGSKQGIAVNDGDTLNLIDINEISGWNTNAINNTGTVNIGTMSTTLLNSKLQGAGTYNLTGGTLKVNDLRNLAMTGITNNGTIEIGNSTDATEDDTLTATISGGTLNIVGSVTSAANNIAGTTNTISENKTLTLTDGELGGDLSGAGAVVIAGTVTSAKNIANAVTVNTDKSLDTTGTITGTVINNGTLTIAAEDLKAEVSNSGTVNLDAGTLADGSVLTGGAVNVIEDVSTVGDNLVAGDGANTLAVTAGKTLTITGGDLARNVTGTTGTTKFTGASESTAIIANKIDVDGGTLIINADNIDGTGNTVTSGVLKLNGGQLDKEVTGAGITEIIANTTLNANLGTEIKVVTGNILTSVADNIGGAVTNEGIVEITGGNLNALINGQIGSVLAVTNNLSIGATGAITQKADSYIIAPVNVIESETNVATKAMFGNITAANQLDVKDGDLIVVGQVTDGKYYVLVAGEAVADGTLQAADLWKKENIALDTSKYLLADYDYVTSDNAIAVKVQAATVEEGNTSGLAAVQQSNITVAKEFTSEVENHLGFINKPSWKGDIVKVRDVANTNKDDYKVETVEEGNANEVMPVQVMEKDKYDKEVWASYIRTKETTEGMKLGEGLEGNNTAQYNGAVVGVDFYSSKKAVTGLAFSYTTGDIDSYSNATSTRNKSKYYGVSFYDRVTNGNTAMIYDIGYIKGDNDISQFYTGQETTADVKTDTYTAGVRYEAEFGTKESRVVPFASFRYMRQNNKDYTNSHNTRFESKNQNLYIPKVGIAWTGDFVAPNSVCTWRPSVEAGYVWNLGDRSVDGNVFVGSSIAPLEYDTVDKSSYYAKAGIELMSKNFTAGLFYRYLKGSAVRNNKWNINVSWAF